MTQEITRDAIESAMNFTQEIKSALPRLDARISSLIILPNLTNTPLSTIRELFNDHFLRDLGPVARRGSVDYAVY